MFPVPEPQVVLVRPLYPINIGATARSMANMGTKKLIVIDPQCPVNLRARQAASKAQQELRGRTTYPSWNEFLSTEPQSTLIAFTARPGKLRPSELFTETLERVFRERSYILDKTVAPISLVFGPEDSGLTNEDIENVHHCCLLPTFGENASFNLSQAVLVAQLLYRQTCLNHFKQALAPPVLPPKERASARFPDHLIQDWLELLGFDLESPKTNALQTLKRLLLSTTPTAKEYKVLNSVIQQTVRKLRRES